MKITITCYAGQRKLRLSTFLYIFPINFFITNFLHCFNNAGKEEKILKQLICTENHKNNSIIALVLHELSF